MSSELHWQDTVEIASRIREREISARDALEHFLDRVAKYNPILNCVVAMDLKSARVRADEADAALGRGELWGPLHGVPTTIKDTFEVVGMPCTAGVAALKEHYPLRNATVVQRLFDAGAVIFGKTNVPPLAADLQTRNDVYGVTGNPWNPDRIAGGSSGGTAVAIAAGLTGLDFGGDIGGSTRNPAHYNNIFGHRPTWGTISSIGQLPGVGKLSEDEFLTPGPLARSARDLRFIFDIVRGSDPAFGHVLKPDLPETPIDDLSKLRVAVWIDNEVVEVDDTVRVVLDDALRRLKNAGLGEIETAHPDFDVRGSFDLFARMGGAITGKDVPADVRAAMPAQIEAAEADGKFGLAMRLRGVLMSYADWSKDSHYRAEIRAKWKEFFDRYDVVLTPTMSVPALPHAGNYFERTIEINGKPQQGRDQLFWCAPQVVANLPSVVFPAGFTGEGLPVGFQVTAPYLEDYRAIRVAELFADTLGAHLMHPPLAS